MHRVWGGWPPRQGVDRRRVPPLSREMDRERRRPLPLPQVTFHPSRADPPARLAAPHALHGRPVGGNARGLEKLILTEHQNAFLTGRRKPHSQTAKNRHFPQSFHALANSISPLWGTNIGIQPQPARSVTPPSRGGPGYCAGALEGLWGLFGGPPWGGPHAGARTRAPGRASPGAVISHECRCLFAPLA